MKHIPQYTEQMTEIDLVPYILYAVVAGKKAPRKNMKMSSAEVVCCK